MTGFTAMPRVSGQDFLETVQRTQRAFTEQRLRCPLGSVVAEVTEACAAFLLETKHHNRSLSIQNVIKWAKTMLHHDWVITGEPLILSDEGRLMDGQHRCRSLLEAKIPTETVIIYGVSPQVFPVMGQGKKRTGGDALAIDDTKNAHAIAAVIRMALRYEQNKLLSMEWPSNEEICTYYQNHREIADSIPWGKQSKTTLTPTIGAFLHYQGCRLGGRGLVQELLSSLRDGEYLEKGEVVHTLREYLLRDIKPRYRGSVTENAHILFALISAWNLLRDGKRRLIKKSMLIRPPEEAVPKML